MCGHADTRLNVKPGGSPDVEKRRARLRKRLRAEWIVCVEEEWLRRTGRTMTAEGLARLLRRYSGDL